MTFNFVAPDPAPAEPPTPEAREESGPHKIVRIEGSDPHAASAPRRRALLVGNPNVGKSVLFGALTGTYVTVSNYPGTTVEITRGRVALEGAPHWELLDTPGTNNLVPMSEDEAVTRDILLSEPSDLIVQVGDAKNLTRTLLLTLQLAELGVPFLLDLNMADEARSRGIAIDLEGLTRELAGVRVNTSAAISGEGVEPVRAYLAERAQVEAEEGTREPLPCAPRFPEDVESAIAEVEKALPTLSVAARGVATMLLAGDRGFGGWLEANVDAATRARAGELATKLSETHGVPAFALLSKLRLSRAQAIVREVQRRADAQRGARANGGRVPWPRAVGVAATAAVIAGVVYDGALQRTAVASASDSLDDYGFFDIVGRIFSRDLVTGWSALSLAFLFIATALGAVLVHRHASARAAAWKLVAAFAIGYAGYWVTSLVQGLALHVHGSAPVTFGALVGLGALATWAQAGDGRDAAVSGFLGRYATHPRWGIPILLVVLFFAYKVVGVFGAGTAVDFLENKIFGNTSAQAPLAAVSPLDALDAKDEKGEDAERLVVVPAGADGAVRIIAQVKHGDTYVADPNARIDVYPGKAKITVSGGTGEAIVTGDVRGAEARVWIGSLNRWAYAFFFWIGIPFVTAFFVGQYGLLTMGVTYAVAIVLPVVATFFFVFSMLEDSGYLPRLAVMANRQLQTIGLNGKAVLPMVLGLGCDTMATLTARIMETKKERVLVTLLLALGIPCSSQLAVIFALMQRTPRSATIVWLGVVFMTIALVGWVAAKVVPGDKSDFLLEMPPIRRPQVGNLVSKTMARIEWYLKEAVPLFLVGTALLFFLDFFNLLVWVHRAGEPVVHHLLGFGRANGVSDRVSEAMLIGFLRRDFGAAGLLDMARGGHLSTGDVAVSMVVITLFIPCIANVFMIVKERGWKVAGLMSAFIFPYAVLVGGLVRLLFNALGG